MKKINKNLQTTNKVLKR